MTYDEFVTQPLALWRKIIHKSDAVSRLEGLCLRSTPELSERVQTSLRNTQERNIVALADARKELNELILSLLDSQNEVRAFLYENLEVEEADILEWKYVNGKPISEIAKMMNIEEQTVRNKINQTDKKAKRLYRKS